MKINYGHKVLRPELMVGMVEAYADVDDALARGRKRRYGVPNDAIARWKGQRTARCGCVRIATHPQFGYGLWDKSRCTA